MLPARFAALAASHVGPQVRSWAHERVCGGMRHGWGRHSMSVDSKAKIQLSFFGGGAAWSS